MNNISEHIKSRRSVRTFDGRELSKADVEKLVSFAKTIDNPYKIPVDFKFMNAKEHGLTCPVTVGTDLVVGGRIKYTEIENKAIELIPDKDKLILVNCRSGRRSKIAAESLAKLGYTKVKEFGGIIDWPYEVEK